MIRGCSAFEWSFRESPFCLFQTGSEGRAELLLLHQANVALVSVSQKQAPRALFRQSP
jgi:signal-transduction protein with cAMP-binding, CBS, and nucleotidyltransferase domain